MVEYPVNKLGGKDDHFSSLQFEVIYFHYYVVFTISIYMYYISFIAIFRRFPACEFPFSQSLWAYEKKHDKHIRTVTSAYNLSYMFI